MVSAADDGAAFLHALARRMSTRVAVFVPTRREPRSLWINGTGRPEEVEVLAQLGQDWLEEHRRHPDVPLVDGVERMENDTVVLAPAWSGRGISGAIVARKELGSVWTGAEMAFVRFVADYYAPLLEGWDSRPQPGARPSRPDSLAPGTDLDAAIRRATGNGELFLRYQPEVDLRTREVVAVEALVRWHHPQRGELGPEAFIAVAERSDLIRILGAWVVNESLREFAALIAGRADRLSLRINVSPVQVAGDLVSVLADALVEHDVPGDQVCVEITENLMSRDTALLASTLLALKRLGVRSAIDDLASGYSNLTRLRSLPVDVVKIDRGLVSGIDTDVRGQAILAALIRLSDELGIRAVVEGAETEAEAATLLRIGCRHAQGHLFGRPMTAAQVAEFLRAR